VLHDIAQWDPLTRTKRAACFLNATKEFRVMLQTVLKPVVVRSESDQNASRATVSGNHDFFIDGQP
jgi:hypothetical protein